MRNHMPRPSHLTTNHWSLNAQAISSEKYLGVWSASLPTDPENSPQTTYDGISQATLDADDTSSKSQTNTEEFSEHMTYIR